MKHTASWNRLEEKAYGLFGERRRDRIYVWKLLNQSPKNFFLLVPHPHPAPCPAKVPDDDNIYGISMAKTSKHTHSIVKSLT